MNTRKRNRLKGFDYSSTGCYFVTICTNEKINSFGQIFDGKMQLNKLGKIAYFNFECIPDHFGGIILDQFVVMPNHVHGIIAIVVDEKRYAYMRPLLAEPERNDVRENFNKSKILLSKIIQQYKASVSREVNKSDLGLFRWQRSFYDRIIRNEKELNNIQE